MAKSAQQMKDRYKSGIATSATAYQEGVRSVTVNPADKAIAAAPKYEQKIMEAIADKRFEAGLQGVTLAGWQQASIAGAAKLQQSAATAAEKYGAYAQAAAPIIAQIKAEVDAMPDVTEADAQARMIRNMELMKQLKGVGRRGRR